MSKKTMGNGFFKFIFGFVMGIVFTTVVIATGFIYAYKKISILQIQKWGKIEVPIGNDDFKSMTIEELVTLYTEISAGKYNWQTLGDLYGLELPDKLNGTDISALKKWIADVAILDFQTLQDSIKSNLTLEFIGSFVSGNQMITSITSKQRSIEVSINGTTERKSAYVNNGVDYYELGGNFYDINCNLLDTSDMLLPVITNEEQADIQIGEKTYFLYRNQDGDYYFDVTKSEFISVTDGSIYLGEALKRASYSLDQLKNVIDDITIGDVLTIDENTPELVKRLQGLTLSDFSGDFMTELLDTLSLKQIMPDAIGTSGVLYNIATKQYEENGNLIFIDNNDKFYYFSNGNLYDKQTDTSVNLSEFVLYPKMQFDVDSGIATQVVEQIDSTEYKVFVDKDNNEYALSQDKYYLIDGGMVTSQEFMQSGNILVIAYYPVSKLANSLNIITLGELIEVNDSSPAVLKSIKEMTIEDLADDDKLKEYLDKVYLKDIIDMTDAPTFLKRLENLTIGELSDTNTVQNEIDSMKLSDLITIDDSSPAMLKQLEDLTVGELSDSQVVEEKINSMVLGDLITVDDSSHIMLKKLEHLTIGELSGSAFQDTIDNIYLYELFDNKDKDETLFDRLANMKYTTVDEEGNPVEDYYKYSELTSALESVTVSVIFKDADVGPLALIPPDTKLEDIPTAMTTIIATSTLGKLYDVGILTNDFLRAENNSPLRNYTLMEAIDLLTLLP